MVFRRGDDAVAGHGRRRLVGACPVAHGRPLARARGRGRRARDLGVVVRADAAARLATRRGLRLRRDHSVHRDRRRAQGRDERRLSLGSRELRRPQSLRPTVRRPAGCVAARRVFSGRALLVRLRARLLLLPLARSLAAPRALGIVRRARRRHRVLDRPGSARRAFPVARPDERGDRVGRPARAVRGLAHGRFAKLPALSNAGDSIDSRSRTVSNTSPCPYSARGAIDSGTDDFTINGIRACPSGSFMPGGTP